MWTQVSEAPVPSTKPVCPGCGKKRSLEYARDYDTSEGWLNRKPGPITAWKYKGYGYFCTLACATRYANNDIEKKAKA
jgi:5'-3' exonuclease